MRFAKPILLGALAGLLLALAALAGLYASPLRQTLYFAADPGLAGLREKLDAYQEWLAQADARIALQGPDADSLRNEEAKAWRNYKAWRTRLGTLARAHEQPSGSGFPRWAYSLRYWAGPAAALAMALAAAGAAWRARNRYRPARIRPGKAAGAPASGPTAGNAEAMARFEAAVKQVARLSREGTQSGQGARPRAEPPPTDLLPIVPSGVDTSGSSGATTVPGTPPAAPAAPVPDAGQDGRETRYFQVGSGWGEPGQDLPAPPGLAMEDEDAPEAAGAPGGFGVMPPTTEVERVERRKDEVLKLARKGMTSSEISRRLRISQDQVEFIIRLRREKG